MDDSYLRDEVLRSAEEIYGAMVANATVFVNVYDDEADDYFYIFGKIIWNGDSDDADAIFFPFIDRNFDVDSPWHLLPPKFAWGAAKDFTGPFPRGFQPEGWEGPLVSR
jgi:hypothetical protein